MYVKSTTDQVMDSLAAAAKKEGFTIDEEKDTRMTVRKGSLFMSIMFGIFVAYAKADAKVSEADDGEVKLVLEWGNPWWQGVFGPMRAKNAMKGYADRFEKVVEDAGGEVVDRKDR
jgi:hypothetical protein